MANKKPATPNSFRTLEELASAVGRDKGTISRWTKRPDWPFSRRAPWAKSDAPKILAWVADTLERQATTDSASATDEVKALRVEKLREEIRKIRADADKGETALAEYRKDLCAASDVERTWAAILIRLRNGVQNLASQILPIALNNGMPHQASATFQEQVDVAACGLLKQLSQDDDEDDAPAETSEADSEEDAVASVPA